MDKLTFKSRENITIRNYSLQAKTNGEDFIVNQEWSKDA